MIQRARRLHVAFRISLFAFCLLTFNFGVVLPASQAAASRPQGPVGQLATMQQYCVPCHNDRAKTAGVSFEGITPESVGQHPDVFEKAVRKLRGRVMPPPGARQPDAAAVDSLVSYLEDSLDRAATQ